MREIEKDISKKAFVNKLKRLIENIKSGKGFIIQVKKRKIMVPTKVEFQIEHEKESEDESLEFELKL